VRRLEVRVQITGDFALTEIEQVFFNPASETVEGLYRFRVPDGALLQRFAVDRAGRLVDGYVRERAQARQAYEQQVYRGSTDDPALLVWDAPNAYRARLYPIPAGATRRILVRYGQWLHGATEEGVRLYRYPMGTASEPPHIQEFSLTADLSQAAVADVRAGMAATLAGDRVVLRRSDFRPRADFWLELIPQAERAQHRAYRAPHEAPLRAPGAPPPAREANERDYFFFPLVLPPDLAPAAAEGADTGLDVVIMADVSAATDPSRLELGRTVAEALASHLRPSDRVAVVSSDLTVRSLQGDAPPALGPATMERTTALLDELARVPAGGATDLGTALADAAALLEPSRSGAVIYIGDGAPTVGELAAEGLLERLARLPHPFRFYAVAVGETANIDLLTALARGGGLAQRITQRTEAAEAALQLWAHLNRPLAQRVTVELGSGIDNVFPRRPVDVVLGYPQVVVGRIRDRVPAGVTVQGMVGGEPFTRTIPVHVLNAPDGTDLRLRWAGARLEQLLLDEAGREAIAELGTRCGLITPYTSFYVPSARELGYLDRRSAPLVNRPRLAVAGRGGGAALHHAASRLFWNPLSLMGCQALERFSDQSAAPAAQAPESVSLALEEVAATDMESEDRRARPSPSTTAGSTGNRYGIRGPADNPAPPAEGARAEAEEAEDDTLRGGDVGEPRPRRARSVAPAAPAPTKAMGGEEGQVAAEPPLPGQAQGAAKQAARHRGVASGGLAALTDATSSDLSGALDGVLQGRIAGRGGSLASSSAGGGGRMGRPQRRRTRPRSDHSNIDKDQAIRQPAVAARQPNETVNSWSEERHLPKRCSDAAGLPLSDRQSLWRERLQQTAGVAQWLAQLRQARRRCEVPSWAARRAFYRLMAARAGSVARMIDLYQAVEDPGGARLLRQLIFDRVRTPEELRLVREAFGPSNSTQEEMITQILNRAKTGPDRIRALRQLVELHPGATHLKVRLLSQLDQANRRREAGQLAHALRVDPLSDGAVRTVIGEMYLRWDKEGEARRVFSEMVEFRPYDATARRRLGDVYRAHGWFDDAYRQYQTLAAIRPDDRSVSLLLAQAAAGAGRVDEALRLEQQLMQSAAPGSSSGLARVALLWSSLRLAKLRHEARKAGATEDLRNLFARLRRSGAAREAGALRIYLVWSHPDAGLSLWTAHPGLTLTRPTDIAPEFGLEAFDLQEMESEPYQLEIRRQGSNFAADVSAELVLVWDEGEANERVHVEQLAFTEGQTTLAWTLTGRELQAATPERAAASREVQ
jgi:Ca-activated chloride channel family protein